MGSRREQQKEETRKLILEAARSLFQVKGFQDTTVRAIASEAGVGLGTIFTHFRDKEALLVASVVGELEAFDRRSRLGMPEGGGVKEKLLHLGREGLKDWDHRPPFVREVLRQRYFDPRTEMRKLRELDRGALETVVVLLREGQEKGEVRGEVDVDLVARAIFSFYLTLVLDWLGDGESDGPGGEVGAAELGRFLDHLFQGIGAGAGTAR